MFNVCRLTTRRAALLRPVGVLRPAVLGSAVMAPSMYRQAARQISTVRNTEPEQQDILVLQRRNRPLSPDLAIYARQLTSTMSAFHRITGIILGVVFYGVTCSFAAGTLIGHPIDTATLISVAEWFPAWSLYIFKSLFAFPFVYHFNNGVRHIVWDFAKKTSLKDVYTTGYITLGITAVFATWLVLA